MKPIFSIVLLAISMNAFGQILGFGGDMSGYYSKTSFSPTQTFESITIIGTLMLKNDIWIIHGTTGNAGDLQDYYPGNLTKPFMVDGLRVSVNATLDPIPEDVKMAGKPITIVTIQKI